MEPSNCVIVDGARVLLPDAVRAAGGTGRTYLDDGEPHLAAGPRRRPLTTLVLHETGGNTGAGAERTMQARGYGVHLLLEPEGAICCYADLAAETCAHAGQANPISVGIEIVNEYRPEAMRPPHGPLLPAQWWTWVPRGKARLYVAPTDAQMAVLGALAPWLCGVLGIPWAFPTAGLSAKKPRITGWRTPPLGWRAKPGPGVVEHSSFSKHADGRYILEKLMESLA